MPLNLAIIYSCNIDSCIIIHNVISNQTCSIRVYRSGYIKRHITIHQNLHIRSIKFKALNINFSRTTFKLGYSPIIA